MFLVSVSSLILPSASLWLAYLTASFLVKLYAVRSRFQRMQKDGLVNDSFHSSPGFLGGFGHG